MKKVDAGSGEEERKGKHRRKKGRVLERENFKLKGEEIFTYTPTLICVLMFILNGVILFKRLELMCLISLASKLN